MLSLFNIKFINSINKRLDDKVKIRIYRLIFLLLILSSSTNLIIK